MQKPEAREYKEYFQRYINLVGEGDYFDLFHKNTEDTIAFFSSIPENKHHFRYAEGKWTIEQVLMHLIDTERMFSYRAFVCSRLDDKTELQSYDDDLYAQNANGDSRSMDSLIEEFKAVRKAVAYLFGNMTEQQSKFLGNNVTHKISARAIAYIMLGHIQHHINTINERYL